MNAKSDPRRDAKHSEKRLHILSNEQLTGLISTSRPASLNILCSGH